MKRCWCRFREINKNTFSNHFSNVSGWITITIYTSCKNKCLTSLSILFVYYSILNNKPKVLKVAKEGMMVIRQRKAERGKDLRDQSSERSKFWKIRVLRNQTSERSKILEIWEIRYMINLIVESFCDWKGGACQIIFHIFFGSHQNAFKAILSFFKHFYFFPLWLTRGGGTSLDLFSLRILIFVSNFGLLKK